MTRLDAHWHLLPRGRGVGVSDDVKAPDAPTGIGGIHAIGKRVSVKIYHANRGWDRIVHPGEREIRRHGTAWARCEPQERAGLGVHHEDAIASVSVL